MSTNQRSSSLSSSIFRGMRLYTISAWRVVRSSPLSTFGFSLILLYVGVALSVAIFGNLVLPYNPLALHVGPDFSPPSLAHPFGTDNLGRDIFSRVLAGTPIDLGIGLGISLLAMTIGGTVGLVSGFHGGVTDAVLMRITDIFLSIPSLVLALAISVALGGLGHPSILNSVEALSFVWWAAYARVARGQTLSVKNQLYVVAARANGTKEYVILGRHVFRNIFDALFIYMSMDIGTVILMFSTLSFLGVGVQPPTPEWGSMVINSQPYLQTQPWIPLMPGFAIFFAVFAFALIGDVLRDLLDPKIRRSML